MDMSLGVILFYKSNARENIITYLMFVVVQAWLQICPIKICCSD